MQTDLIKLDGTELQAHVEAQKRFLESGLEILADYVLDSDEEKSQAEELLKHIKRRFNGIEDARKEAVSATTQAIDAINLSCRPTKRKLKEMETTLKKMLVNFEKARRAAEAKLLDAVADAAEQGEDETSQALLEQTGEGPSSASGISMSEFWTYKVSDPAKVPAKYWALDDAAIRKDIAAGVREIEGLEVIRDIRMSVKAR